MKMNTTVSGAASPSIKRNATVAICKDLFSVLAAVKNVGAITTYGEVLDSVRDYIAEKKLYDPFCPIKISCENDLLSSVLGSSCFTLSDVRRLLRKVVFPVNSNDSIEVISSHVKEGTEKRKLHFEQEGVKKKCKHQPTAQILSPMVLAIPPSPSRFDASSEETEFSLQGYETSFVKDSSDDDIWFFEKNEDFLSCTDIIAVEETYHLEYEVESVKSHSSHASFSESDSEFLDSGNATIITVVCKTDSDQEFWADKSSDEEFGYDIEISESDRWKCTKCGSFNNPPMRFCLKCWDTRRGWLEPSDKIERIPPRNRREKSKKREHKNGYLNEKESEDHFESSQPFSPQDSVFNSQETLPSSQYDSEIPCSSEIEQHKDRDLNIEKLCIICCSKPANASIIHGKYAHSISCYRCARKLQHQKRRCPICRRSIDRVVYNISGC